MQDFRNLEVWRKSHAITISIYQITASFPRDERFGLTSQLRRAAASIGANLAEGCGRGSDAEFKRFVQIALGSASELDYHILLARDLQMMQSTVYDQLRKDLQSARRMLAGLLRRLNSNSQQPTANSQ